MRYNQTPRENISTPLNPLTASEKQLLKQSIKESQAIYKMLLPSKQIKCRKGK